MVLFTMTNRISTNCMAVEFIWCMFVAVASVAASSRAIFTIDTSASPVEMAFPLLDSVGSGHGALALRADYRDHLSRVQRDIGFKHIRGHGLLNDDMSTYLNGHANLINLFSVFDFYLSVGQSRIL